MAVISAPCILFNCALLFYFPSLMDAEYSNFSLRAALLSRSGEACITSFLKI